VSFGVSVLSIVIDAFMPASVKHGLDTISADQTLTLGQLVDTLVLIAPILVLGLAVLSVMAAAIYRLIFRHDDPRFGYLRLGSDELRLMGLTLIYIGITIGLVFAVSMASAIIVALAAMVAPMAQAFLSMAAVVFSLGVVIYVLVRLSLAPVITFAERRLSIFESWNMTRGYFWQLLGAYGLAFACIFVIYFLVLVVFSGIAGVIMLLSGGQLSDLNGILKPEVGSLRSYLSFGIIAYMLVNSVVSALYNAVIAAPGAVAYQKLHGAPPSRPLTAQPEAS
jgi:hypothetical protein